MSEIQNESLPEERGITPVTGAGDDGRKSMLKRGFGALALILATVGALYGAILRFQKRYFPARQSGFIDPGDAVLARMEQLASRPAAAPVTRCRCS